MRIFKSKTKKLPRAVEKSLLPREEFISREKERFLAAFDASPLARNAYPANGRPAYLTTVFKIGIGALAVLFIGVGLSAYADTANVSATNPLYSLKRIGENVQLALAPMSEKPQLQATFAVRRANEIAALQTSAPSSTLIPQLTSDLDQDINTSLSALTGGGSNGTAQATSSVSSTVAVNPSPTSSLSVLLAASTSASTSVDAAPIEVYCNAFKVSTSGVLIGQLEATLALRANGFAEFNEQCASDTSSAHQVPQKNPNRRDHSPVNGTSTTPQASGDGHAGAFFGYGGSAGNLAASTAATTTATATTTSSATAATSTSGSASTTTSASASIPYIPPVPPIRL